MNYLPTEHSRTLAPLHLTKPRHQIKPAMVEGVCIPHPCCYCPQQDAQTCRMHLEAGGVAWPEMVPTVMGGGDRATRQHCQSCGNRLSGEDMWTGEGGRRGGGKWCRTAVMVNRRQYSKTLTLCNC